MWKSAWTGILPLAIIEPTTSVLVYPLIAELYSRSSLALAACHTTYVTLFFIFKICITISSLILVQHSIKQIIHLGKCNENGKSVSFNNMYVFSIIWNALFSYVVISVRMRSRRSVKLSSEECFAAQMDDSVVWAGLKSLIPQSLVLCLVIVVVVALLILRRSAAQDMNIHHEARNLQHDCIRQYDSMNLYREFMDNEDLRKPRHDFKNLQHEYVSPQHDFMDRQHDFRNIQEEFTNSQHDFKNLEHEFIHPQQDFVELQHDFMNRQHAFGSSWPYLWSVAKPIILAIGFQSLYFGLGFGFVFCSCGWFKTLSKPMDILNWTCLVKSVVVVAVSVSARRHRSGAQCSQSALSCRIV